MAKSIIDLLGCLRLIAMIQREKILVDGTIEDAKCFAGGHNSGGNRQD